MKGKRTKISFGKHKLHITEQEGLVVHQLKLLNTITHSIKFINTNGIMVVTGDFGHWLFCREFHPHHSSSGVSDGYWVEKLQISSKQNPYVYDKVRTEKQIKKEIKIGLKQYGWEGDELKEMKEYMQECLSKCDDEHEYELFAYRNMPSFADSEQAIFIKDYNYQLKIVFDGFEEICRRLKLKEIKRVLKNTKTINTQNETEKNN